MKTMEPDGRGRRAAIVVTAWAVLGGVLAAGAPAQTEQEGGGARAAKARLSGKLEEGGAYAEHGYSAVSWNAMRFALNEARALADKEAATPAELNEAGARLQAKIDALEERAPLPDPEPGVGLSASLFAAEAEGPVNHVALMWAGPDGCQGFEIQRAARDEGPYTTVYAGSGASYHDYALADGTWYYRAAARYRGGSLTSRTARVATMAMPAGLRAYSNEAFTRGGFPEEPLKVGDTFYAFRRTYEDRRLKQVRVRTSADGATWEDGPIVLDQGSHPDLEDCKFESGTMFYDEVRERIVWWAHWELSGPRYGHGRAVVASAVPGEPFTVHHIYNPMGVQVRDMSVFVDDDRRGYLVTAGNVPGQGANATLYIFRLNDTYTDVTGIAAKVLENHYREAPHIVKLDGTYYLFFSQAAGWYPSQAAYVSARSLEGPWSELRRMGNPSTFSAQSGEVIDFGRGVGYVPVMLANRWIRSEATSRNAVLPIHCAGGFAFCDYAPTLLLDPDRDLVLPLHAGRLLSQGKAATSSIPGREGHDAGRAFDGDYFSSFQSDEKTWPFSVTVDLGAASLVDNVQISWHLHKGSEAFYQYTVEGSPDGEAWEVMVDRTDKTDPLVSRTYGFSSDLITDPEPARFVRVNVHQAVLHNNPNNWYPPTLYEVKAYGREAP